jgi:hypothetical protein
MNEANIVTMTREEYDQAVATARQQAEHIDELENTLHRSKRQEPFVEIGNNWFSGRRVYNPDEATQQLARERDNAVDELKILRSRSLWERILNK